MFPKHIGTDYTFPFQMGEMRQNSDILGQSKTKIQQANIRSYRSTFGDWHFGFIRFRRPYPTSFTACSRHLSWAVPTSCMQFFLQMSYNSGISKILGSLLQPQLHFNSLMQRPGRDSLPHFAWHWWFPETTEEEPTAPSLLSLWSQYHGLNTANLR